MTSVFGKIVVVISNIKNTILLYNTFTKIILIIVSITYITSCNSVKRLSDEEYLLQKNTIYVNQKKSKKIELERFLRQKPNQKVLGMPFALHVYNWSNPNFEKTYEEWIINHSNTNNFVSSVFSKKQVKTIYKFNNNWNNYIKKSGEEPVIVNSKKTKKSVKTLKEYYKNRGFFDVKVSSKEHIIGEKLKSIDYVITTNNAYYLDSIQTKISSPILNQIYKSNAEKSFIKNGQQFDRSNFEKEQIRLTQLYRNSGIYHFGKDYIKYDMDMRDSTSFKKNIVLKITNQVVEKDDSVYTKPFKVQKVTKINVYTDYSYNTKDKKYLDSVTYKGYTFFAHKKLKFSPKYLSNVFGITPNGIYKDSELTLTKQYLNDLKIFRTPITINYRENKDENLTANVFLTPLKKFGIDTKLEATHSNIKPFGILGKFGIIDRNIFRGSEIFEFSIQGSFLNVSEDTSDPNFNFFGLTAWEIGANTSLKIPRIFFPFKTNKLIPKRMRPTTNIGLSTSFQKNIGLDRQNITGNISYNWKSSNKVKHQFDLINIQYINNVNSINYFDIFGSELVKLGTVAQTIIDPNNMDNNGQITNELGYINYVLSPSNNFINTDFENYNIVQKVKERRDIITEDVLVPILSYSYTFNNKKGIKDNAFSFFRGKIASAGSITSTLTKKNAEGRKVLFGLPVAQYVKLEMEYKRYWNLFNDNNVVFRTFVGAALPFGNSTEIPFSRSYRAGGSNDIRAWKTFDLGPGSSKSNLDFNIGNLKFISSFEYRFKIINSLYSALFIDAGNVWDITNSDLTSEEAKFKSLKSLQDIAIGSGFGLRYDFGFLIFRTDFGFKTYEPYLQNNKWFRNYNFKHAVFNFGINYPF